MSLPFHPYHFSFIWEPSLFLSELPLAWKKNPLSFSLPKTKSFRLIISHQQKKMAKGGKLTKLKSVLKKWNSFSNKQSRHNVSSIACDDDSSCSRDLHPVYVGKSRRRYLVTSDVIDHPLFRELVERSGDSDDDTINVACEVVLFEHLLWMLDNADPQPESLDELVEFYACWARLLYWFLYLQCMMVTLSWASVTSNN